MTVCVWQADEQSVQGDEVTAKSESSGPCPSEPQWSMLSFIISHKDTNTHNFAVTFITAVQLTEICFWCQFQLRIIAKKYKEYNYSFFLSQCQESQYNHWPIQDKKKYIVNWMHRMLWWTMSNIIMNAKIDLYLYTQPICLSSLERLFTGNSPEEPN